MKILYFASLRESIGKSEEEITTVTTVEQLRDFLMEKYPQAFDKHIITAVNKEVVTKNITLQDGDEVAFYPPVTGG